MVIPIRNTRQKNRPRVFDVVVDNKGKILKIKIQHIKDKVEVDMNDVQKQIEEQLKNI